MHCVSHPVRENEEKTNKITNRGISRNKNINPKPVKRDFRSITAEMTNATKLRPIVKSTKYSGKLYPLNAFPHIAAISSLSRVKYETVPKIKPKKAERTNPMTIKAKNAKNFSRSFFPTDLTVDFIKCFSPSTSYHGRSGKSTPAPFSAHPPPLILRPPDCLPPRPCNLPRIPVS